MLGLMQPLRYLSMVLKRLLSAQQAKQPCSHAASQSAPKPTNINPAVDMTPQKKKRSNLFLFLFPPLLSHPNSETIKACVFVPACTTEACWSVYLNRDGHVGRRAVFLAG